MQALFKKGWRSVLYEAAMAGLPAVRRGTPLSRERLRTVTGLARSTQRRHEKRAGTKILRNVAETSITADYLPGLREFELSNTLFEHEGKIYKRLPDSRQPAKARRVGYSRSKHINALLRLVTKAGRDLSCKRVYCSNLAAAVSAYRQFNSTSRATFYDAKPSISGLLWQSYAQAWTDYLTVR